MKNVSENHSILFYS